MGARLTFCASDSGSGPKPASSGMIQIFEDPHMGGCQNYGPVLGTVDIRVPILL